MVAFHKTTGLEDRCPFNQLIVCNGELSLVDFNLAIFLRLSLLMMSLVLIC